MVLADCKFNRQMKEETKSLKFLKKVDDTSPAKKARKNTSSRLISKSRVKRECKKAMRLPPGQTVLTFTPSIIGPRTKKLEFTCFDERTMDWPEHFTSKLKSHSYDNDQESNEYIVNREVERGIATLVQEITFKKIMEMEDTIGFF